MTIVLNEDRTTPTVAVSVTYRVGWSSEVGRTGFARLFEHLMFEGGANAPKGEQFKLIAGQGGSLNGTTNSDRTNCYQVLPSNDLELALWLESDRMRWLSLTPENFENQRAVVQEEYECAFSPPDDGGVGLDEVVVIHDAQIGSPLRRHDTHRHRLTETEWIANGQHDLDQDAPRPTSRARGARDRSCLL